MDNNKLIRRIKISLLYPEILNRKEKRIFEYINDFISDLDYKPNAYEMYVWKNSVGDKIFKLNDLSDIKYIEVDIKFRNLIKNKFKLTFFDTYQYIKFSIMPLLRKEGVKYKADNIYIFAIEI